MKFKEHFVETPEFVSKILFSNLSLNSNARLLEPSAGEGHIISYALKQNYSNIVGVEINSERFKVLKEKFKGEPVELFHGDYLSQNIGLFDLIIMSPPFDQNQDIAHVNHAFSQLNSGGQLRAIVSFNHLNRHKDFYNMVKTYSEYEPVVLKNAFKEVGSSVKVVLIFLRKP